MKMHGIRYLTAEELDAVTGGMETVLQYGGTKIEISATARDYMVCTFVKGKQGTCTLVLPHNP